ncbi:putative SAM-dependent methyltransferase [Vibrio nigripulchritudo SOn1]|uniref:SAM-dependent methyltransferase n=1 Tax=Vibrio nigripulchritudo SOn1 TaxID=1238450 RepID=A0AAV2VTM9_9VIBR|nr:class I SAM-dependent methyltransferase [Vibrio nigripulchritudo]CCO48083.1 putative SAM-dependent methyltransferase [Vibrio nigripulchritudo SOn1]
MKNAKDFWNKSAPKYAKRKVRDEAVYQKKLAITQDYFDKDWNVLEFGCGTGTTAITHAPFVNHILAIDIAETMLEIARDKAQQAGVENIEFKEGTLASTALEPASFDAVLGLNVMHLMENLEDEVKRVYELLKPNGIFVSSTALIGQLNMLWQLVIPAMQRLNLAPYVNRFTKDELCTILLNAGFSIECEWQPEKDSVFIVARKPDSES